MSICSSDIYKIAEKLSASADCEAEFRAVIGRAYYSAYHKCNEFHSALPSPGLEPDSNQGAHAKLIKRLGSPTVTNGEVKKQSKMLSYMLQTLKKDRTDADYELSLDIALPDAKRSVLDAGKIIALASGAGSGAQ